MKEVTNASDNPQLHQRLFQSVSPFHHRHEFQPRRKGNGHSEAPRHGQPGGKPCQRLKTSQHRSCHILVRTNIRSICIR
jgi:hypothetical protein